MAARRPAARETRDYSFRTDWGRFGVCFRGERVSSLRFPERGLNWPELDGREGARYYI